MAALERRLVARLHAANQQYQLQDLACSKCKQVGLEGSSCAVWCCVLH